MSESKIEYEIALDIETVPRLEVMEKPLDFFKGRDRKIVEENSWYLEKGNYDIKDEEVKTVILKYKKFLDELGLSPLTGKIVCICYILRDLQTGAYGEFSECGDDEGFILKTFWKKIGKTTLLNSRSRVRLITFNGKDFDMPYIYRRSEILGIEPSRPLPNNNYNDQIAFSSGHHLDISKEFGRSGSLDVWAKVFGLPGKTSEGSEVKDMFYSGEYNKIKEYCLNDCKITLALYDKIINSFMKRNFWP